MDIFFQIIVSLITSVITWIILIFGRKIIIPYYEELVYKGISIEGIWCQTTSYNNGNERYTETLTLKQKANSIIGVYACTNIISGQDNSTSVYNIKGEIKDGFAYLVAEVADKNKIGIGTFVLKVALGGHSMLGVVTLLDRGGNTNEIVPYAGMKYIKQ